MIEHIKPFYQVEANKTKRNVKNLNKPINFNLIITKKCNANCIHCCANANETNEFLSLDNLKSILKIAEENKIFYFVVTGGEPLMYPYIWKLLDMSKNKFGILMNTNGTIITDEIAKKLSSYNIANVHISLDAPNEEIYAKQRGSTTKLSQVISGIKNLLKHNVNITTKMVVTNLNKNYIENIIKLSVNLGVKKLSIAWFKPVGRGLKNNSKLMIPKLEVKALVKKLYELKETYSNKIKLSFDDSQCFPFLLDETKSIKYRKLCGDYFFRIDYNGDVFPCPFLNNKIGNIFKSDILTLWNDAALVEQREASFGKNLGGVCKTCKNNILCAGGCRSRAININGNMKSQDPLCWIE